MSMSPLRIINCAFLSLPLILSFDAFAQNSYVPPKIPNKDVDQFGVELKSGSYYTVSPEIVGIGDGQYRLSYYYIISEWNDTIPNYRGELYINTANNAIRAKIGEKMETFYNSAYSSGMNNVVIYEPYLKNGSILYRELNGSQYTYVYMTKDGVKTFYNPIPANQFYSYPVKISYPNGYEITLGAFIRDNKGYAIQSVYENSTNYVNIQAINMAINHCSTGATAICSVNYNRIGQYKMPSFWSISLSNAIGETTHYTYSRYTFNTMANTYESVTVPTAIDRPSGIVDEIKLFYNYGQANIRLPSDLLITKVNYGGTEIEYSYDKVSIPTGGNASPGYHVRTIPRIGGQRLFEAYSVIPPTSPGSSPRTPTTMLTYKDGNNNQTTFQSDKFGRVVGETLPNGAFTRHEFDDRNNFTTSSVGGTNVPTLVTRRIFPPSCSITTQATCNLPSSITDPRGYTTDYTYNSRGQLLTVAYPAPATGAIRSTITYTYAMRNAYIKDANGSAISAGPPISMLMSEQSCKTLASCAGTTDEIIKLYDYGPTIGINNLQIRGVGIRAYDEQGQLLTRWTCYKYNYFGEKIAEISPRAGAASCS